MGITYGKSIITDGLTLFYDASNVKSYSGTGTVWKNLAKNDYHANLVGPTFNDYYFTFDEANENYAWIETLKYNSSNKISEMSAFTWMRTENNTPGIDDNWAFIDFDRSNIFNFYIHGNGRIGFSGATTNYDNFENFFDLFGNNYYNDGDWHYIGWTFSVANQEIIMYGDGEIDATFTANGNMEAIGTGGDRFGFIGDGSEAGVENGARNEYYFDGDIAVIKFYDDKVLTPDEVKQNYNAFKRKFHE